MSGPQFQAQQAEPMRRQFPELHPKDQTIKLNRKARIESNWAIDIRECLPFSIRPRVELKKGAKARVGDASVSHELWWNWSVELLRSLEELSTMTATKLPFAQELLQLEVSQRQQNPKHPQRKIVEVLLGDVQRVIDGMRRNQQQRNMNATNGDGDDDDLNTEGNGFIGGGDYHGGNDEYGAAMGGDDSMFADGHGSNATSSPSRQLRGPNLNTLNGVHSFRSPMDGALCEGVGYLPPTTRPVGMELRATEMRARSIRLRAQAQRLEAEALELEADAADFRAQLQHQPGAEQEQHDESAENEEQ